MFTAQGGKASQDGDLVRVLNWNIGHGGGSRIPAIRRHIESVNPDVLALTEFQIRNEAALRTDLNRLGYPFIATSNPADKQNGLLVASRWALDRDADQGAPDIDRERWLAVRLADLDLDVLVLHVPGAPDNKFDHGYGMSGAKRKELLWERAIAYAVDHKERRTVMVGDFNTGLRIDAEGAMFKMSRYMTSLIDTGFVDAWRHLNPQVRDYTWYSKRKDKATGVTRDLNGFRLDYIFVSPTLSSAVAEAKILHAPRTAGASDHASVVADINIPHAGGYQIPTRRESSTEAAPDDESGAHQRSDSVDSGIRHGAITLAGQRHARIDLPPGSLPDMTCGVNGQNFVQQFRPTYITADWTGGVLNEVRIWGPRLLQDGALGKRELDHRWKKNAAAGGVKPADLPAPVAALLRPYLMADESSR